MPAKLELIRKYLSLLESFSNSPTAFAEVVTSDFVQKEFPNLLNKNGQQSDLADTLRRATLGKKMLAKQSFEILNSIEDEKQVALEVRWEGVLAIDAGPLKTGQVLRANFCFICEFRDGKIFRQRNYDCFEAFSP